MHLWPVAQNRLSLVVALLALSTSLALDLEDLRLVIQDDEAPNAYNIDQRLQV